MFMGSSTWVISKVLHTVCFLFKNDFILQNTFTSLKNDFILQNTFTNLNIISIVLYHSGPTFGKVLYSCPGTFVVDASDYSGHLIRHLLIASEAFLTESRSGFFTFGNKPKSGGLMSPPDFDL
jgi:hypothetical protein